MPAPAAASCFSPTRRCSSTSCVNGQNILAFEEQIEWDVTRVKGGARGCWPAGLFNIALRGSGLVALCSDGQRLGSGESLQIGFSGQGWVLIRPSEGRPVVVAG